MWRVKSLKKALFTILVFRIIPLRRNTQQFSSTSILRDCISCVFLRKGIIPLVFIGFALVACSGAATILPMEDLSSYDLIYKEFEYVSPTPYTASIASLHEESQAQISQHLDGIVFNAQFLIIPTYEGGGQIVHPQVLFFPEKFMGYHYIMVMTPYPFSNNTHENPSILGSQDGIIWEVPEGVVNPVVGVPVDVAYGGHYSDPFILRNGDKLELWFRHTLAQEPQGRRNAHNRLYRAISEDLINWSELETILDCPDTVDHFMSVVVMFDGSTYRLWYANFNSRLFMIESDDLINWSEREQVTADMGGLGIWHHEIVFTGERYEALFTSSDRDNHPSFRLFYAVSDDGLDFGIGNEIIIQNISPELEGLTVHKCTFVKIDGVYQMYIAAFDHRYVWRLFYFEIAEEHLYRLFD